MSLFDNLVIVVETATHISRRHPSGSVVFPPQVISPREFDGQTINDTIARLTEHGFAYKEHSSATAENVIVVTYIFIR